MKKRWFFDEINDEQIDEIDMHIHPQYNSPYIDHSNACRAPADAEMAAVSMHTDDHCLLKYMEKQRCQWSGEDDMYSDCYRDE